MPVYKTTFLSDMTMRVTPRVSYKKKELFILRKPPASPRCLVESVLLIFLVLMLCCVFYFSSFCV